MNKQKNRIEKYRLNVIRILAIITIIVFFTEVGVFIDLKTSKRIIVTDELYWFRYMMIPCLINVVCVLGSYLINYNPRFSFLFKNYTPIIAAGIMSFGIAASHNMFITSLCGVCIPVMLVTVYGDFKMIRNITIMSYLVLVMVTIFAHYDAQKNYKYLYIEAFIIGLVLCSVYLSSVITLRMFRDNYSEIEERILKEQQLKEELLKDHLTGLYNHTAFYRFLIEEMENCRLENQVLALAVIDIDDFKKVNDIYGHENGNLVLIRLAAYMTEYCYIPNIVCRYGGEEFAIIFPGLTSEEAGNLMEQVRIDLELHHFSFMNENHVTISCGICQFQNNEKVEADDLFRRADEIMYRAKHSGKNRVISLP